MKYTKFKFLVLVIFFVKCSPSFKVKDDFSKYQKTFIEKSKYSPSVSEIEQNTKVNVVVLDFDFSGVSDNNAQNAPISQYVTSKIDSILNSIGYINVLDRKITGKAAQEIVLKETNGNFKYSGPKEAEYAIYGKITNSTFSSTFDARTGANVFMSVAKLATMGAAMANRRGGLYVDASNSSIPGLYKYTAVIEGEIKIIELKTMKEIVAIPFKQIENKEENATTANGKIAPAKTFDTQMITNGLEKVLKNAKRTIQNTIPIIAYVTGRMDIPKSDKPIFKINVGAEYGIKPKWNIVCESPKEQANDLTGKIEIEKEIYPGYTTDVIYSSSCFMIFDKLKDAENVKIGDRCLIAPDIRKLKSIQD